MDATEDHGPPAPAPDALAEVREVVGRARRGDAAALPRLRGLLDGRPGLWQKYGDLAAQVEQSWVSLAGGDDLLLRESVTRYAARLRAELTRSGAPPVERLLAERAVATWLQLHYYSAMEANAAAGDAPAELLQMRARRQGQAERAHARALATLAAVQKLTPEARPALAAPATTSARAGAEAVAVAAVTPELHAEAAKVAVAGEAPELPAMPALHAGAGCDDAEASDGTPADTVAERVRVGVVR